MRLATVLSLAALPALVAANAAPAWHHRHRQAAAPHRRQGLGGIIGSILNPGGEASSTPAPPRSSSSVVPPPSSSSQPPPSSSSKPPTPPSSSSSAPPPSSSSSSSSSTPPPPSSSPTTSEEAKETSKTDSPSQTPSESVSASAPPAVSVVTKTVDGMTQVITESASSSGKPSNQGIGTGAIIGIAVGAGLVVVVIVVVIVMFARRNRRTSDDEAIRWPELNRHGDSDAVHALPAHRTDGHGVSDRRMSLGSDLDGPSYMSPDTEMVPNTTGLNGSNFGAASMLNDQYNEKYGAGYDDGHRSYPDGRHYDDAHLYEDPTAAPHRGSSPYAYDDDYTSFPPPVQPQPSPVHGVRYDWETDGSYSDHHNQQYAAMQRGGSPPMAGVGSGAVSYPPQQPHY